MLDSHALRARDVHNGDVSAAKSSTPFALRYYVAMYTQTARARALDLVGARPTISKWLTHTKSNISSMTRKDQDFIKKYSRFDRSISIEGSIGAQYSCWETSMESAKRRFHKPITGSRSILKTYFVGDRSQHATWNSVSDRDDEWAAQNLSCSASHHSVR